MKSATSLGITLGDINGIGPEIALKAAYRARWPARVRLILVGSGAVLQAQARAFKLPLPPPWTPGCGLPPKAPVSFWDPAPDLQPRWRPGRVERDSAEAAHAWICAAARACLGTKLDGMITAPICKEAFHKAGLPVPGHTELLAALTGTRRFAMLLMGGPLRVLLVTRHLPLAGVSAALSQENILDAIRMAGEALPWLGCRRRRIGVCGLNPHAGDGGALGAEEKTLIQPAIRRARRLGLDVMGPVPADAIFYQAVHGRYDAVVSMYHDQGLGPLKMLAFETGVNITLGLPIVRTSPDHGTAFDIAGKGIASASSMTEAIRWARVLSRRKNPWEKSRRAG